MQHYPRQTTLRRHRGLVGEGGGDEKEGLAFRGQRPSSGRGVTLSTINTLLVGAKRGPPYVPPSGCRARVSFEVL
ncbi:hypothetical protein NPIL_82272 [Nephila pilipes]|uniref:Uncharacterized protein n=1 Tax=Nephila pilipes TaxID=299642 RepID=A0A8X6QV56_NEPPI|nr:hypothetical protein NPIL_82272 [Nephila pilipes]